MDALTASIVVILGKYALDKGVELGKEVGPRALETAREMFALALERIGRKKPETAAEFPEHPQAYEAPLEMALEEEVQADADFAEQLGSLLEQYEQQAQEHASAQGMTYAVTTTRDGAIAQGKGATALGAGATQIQVGGDVSGGVTTGGERPDDQP